MTLSVSGSQITFADASTQNTAATGFGFKNRIINGAMVIDQRNAGASVTATATFANTYLIDRFYYYVAAASKFTAQQNAGAVTPPAGFVNYLGITSSSSYSVGSGEQFSIGQNIEGFNISDFGWGTANAQTVTLSFWVRSSLTGTFGGSLRQGSGARSYPFIYTISSANTWEQKTVTIVGDTSGTWATNNTTGIILSFGLGVGTSLSGTAGSWSGSNFASATGATSVVGTNGATFYITGVQLEKGSTATSFDYRPYGTELSLCQRYYEIGTAYGEGYQTINAPIGIGGKFQVAKRTTPTTTYPTFTNITNARAGADRAIYLDGYSRYCLANATGALAASETFTASAEL